MPPSTTSARPTAPDASTTARARRNGTAGVGALIGGPRRRRRLAQAIVLIAVAVAGVIVVALWPDRDAPRAQAFSGVAQEPERLVPAPLADEARRVAVRFVQTAVARRDLSEAWSLVGPNLRGGLTREQWISGANPVVPYPIDELEVAPFKVDASSTRSALLEVALLPRKGSGVRAQVFFLELRKLGSGGTARWVVDNWVPRASAVVPR